MTDKISVELPEKVKVVTSGVLEQVRLFPACTTITLSIFFLIAAMLYLCHNNSKKTQKLKNIDVGEKAFISQPQQGAGFFGRLLGSSRTQELDTVILRAGASISQN